MLSEAELEKELYNNAVSLLARREHAERELRQKLFRKQSNEKFDGCDSFEGAVSSVLERLKGLGFLSDARYAQMLLRSRYARGFGPERVRQELQQGGLDNELIALSFEEFEEDWFESALRAREKRFGLGILDQDIKLKAKQVRFLSSRGFSFDQVNYAIDAKEDDGW
jgi:regulatory protein